MSHLYVMKSGDSCKIGISKDVSRRIKQVQTGCPNKIEDVWVSPDLEYASECEKILHSYFEYCRSSGEWFSVSFDEACRKAKEVTGEGSVAIYTLCKKFEQLLTELKALRCEIAKRQGETQMDINQSNANCNPQPFMSIVDASKVTGVSVYALRKGVRAGWIPCVKSGCKTIINVPELLITLKDRGYM